ncbi:MAG: hypothetical protein KGY66_08105 [Candidatus Thermoplasmatota archaeon]|nr:hypothetical protein [Candidatus Thermoplasmatota archaeon]MBS3790860.1 hypothetical protein [Candidatus Thermoplasmatota archaeon]
MKNAEDSTSEFNITKEWFKSHYTQIQKEHPGKFMAILKPGEILIREEYLDLIADLEEENIDLKKSILTNIPKENPKKKLR